ncbi:MAG: peptide/nickel transport system permease protein [Solirubrobacteraceae bacterium]|jgi:peptide/nickel transport system permease protein|nr:peptide/nickel transport system permease protein [Solirubrobacteraceae bacterium]
MGRFVVRRLIAMVLVLFAISVLTFLIFFAISGGDQAERLAGRTASQTQIEAVRHEFGFDKSLPVQYVKTMGKLFTGKLVSYTQGGVSVVDQIKERIPPTLSLVIGAGLLWLFSGVALGVFSAVRAGRFSDRLVTVLSIIGISMPVFVLGALLSYYLGYKARIFPNGGYTKFADDPWQWFYHLLLPWLTLAVLFIGFYSRVMRSNMLDTMSEDYIRTARAKGLSERRILIRHVLRNSLIPIVTLFGLDFGSVIGGGAILTESVFNIPGVGQYAATSVDALDIPPVLAVVIFGAFFIVLFNAIVDILYAALDPRIRLS